MVRERLFSAGGMKVSKMHALTVKHVNAAAQAEAYHALLPACSPEEVDILKRGRNANTAKTPKNATAEQYRKATGVETLFGYLYLRGETKRAHELFAIAWEAKNSAD